MRSFLIVVCLLLPTVAHAGPPRHAIDPRTVQRYEKGYRYNQAGWIVVHVEGDPYDRGVQHGRLLAPEIAAYLRCFAASLGHKAPSESWKLARTLCNALFLRGHDKEYLEEMKGIADGASDAGARFDGRRLDLLDVVTLNAWPEIMTLDHGLNAEPTPLDSFRFPRQPQPKTPPKTEHCSAFAATGPATKDGKIVFGHITMFGLYPSNFYNVWLDVKPTKGHRVVMQSFPGGIHSGMDYYLNDAGIMISETTISQTRFDVKGTPLATRIRKAIQYADSIDKVVAILEKDNNGLYTNEWLLGDAKTNEIAMFELGTRKTRLWRSSKDQWFGGTKGFYWGCNNTKDLEVRLETLASTKDRPSSVSFVPSERDRKWLKLYDSHKGKIDESFGKLAFTTPPLSAYSSLDVKFTTTDMAKKLETWATFGPPLGKTWAPTFEQRSNHPEVRPLVSHPWTVLTASEPPKSDEKVVDLHDLTGKQKLDGPSDEQRSLELKTAWRGTLLPKTDGDVWLTSAFAAHERHVALETALRERHKDKLPDEAAGRLAVSLFSHRASYNHAVCSMKEVPLVEVASDLRESHWFRLAQGKGVLLLEALHKKLGNDKYVALMDDFGEAHGGKEVTTAQFRAHAAKVDGKLDEFFSSWLEKTGLPGENGTAARSVTTFYPEIEDTIIVYGTADEAAANRDSASALEEALRRRGANVSVAIKSDKEVSDDELSSNHVLLIGRSATNAVSKRFEKHLPVTFGLASAKVGKDVYAHADTAVIAATQNPLKARYSVVVIAGLQAAATRTAALAFADRSLGGEVVILRQGKTRSLVVTK